MSFKKDNVLFNLIRLLDITAISFRSIFTLPPLTDLNDMVDVSIVNNTFVLSSLTIILSPLRFLNLSFNLRPLLVVV